MACIFWNMASLIKWKRLLAGLFMTSTYIFEKTLILNPPKTKEAKVTTQEFRSKGRIRALHWANGFKPGVMNVELEAAYG